MKITHVMDSGGYYGKEHVVFELIKQQIKDGHAVNLIVLGKDVLAITEQANSLQVEITYLNMKAGFSLADICRLRSEINLTASDIIHSHCSKSGIYMALSKPNGYLVRTIHGYITKGKFSKSYLKYLIDRWSFGRFDQVVGVSDNMKEFGANRIIPNGISEPTPNSNRIFDASTANFIKSSISPGNKLVGFIGRLSREKNPCNLINAVALLRNNVKLIIIGDGPDRKFLEELVNSHPISDIKKRVHFTGYVPDPIDYIPYFDIYVQPSYTEGTPISVLENMALGIPCLLTPVGGMKEIIENSAAFLCRTDSTSIFYWISYILDLPSENTAKIISNSRKLFEEKYTVSAMACAYQKLYNEAFC